MADKYKKRYTAGEALEEIFNDEHSLDEQIDCGSDVEIVPDSKESENDNDLHAQITQIISNLELQDQEAFDHANSSHFQATQESDNQAASTSSSPVYQQLPSSHIQKEKYHLLIKGKLKEDLQKLPGMEIIGNIISMRGWTYGNRQP